MPAAQLPLTSAFPCSPKRGSAPGFLSHCAAVSLALCAVVSPYYARAQAYFAGTAPVALGTAFKDPVGVAVDPSGDVFVVDIAKLQVEEIIAVDGVIPANPVIRTLGSGWNYPQGLALDAAGDIFVADSSTAKEIVAVDGVIPSSPVIRTLSAFADAQGVAVDRYGNVFVAEPTGAVIWEIVAVNGSIPPSPNTIPLGSGFLDPSGVAVDNAGDIFVADFGHALIKEIVAVNGSVPSNPTILSFGLGYFYDPVGLALDQSDNIFVVDGTIENVKSGVTELTVSSGYNDALSLSGGFFPAAVAVDPRGDLFVADSLTSSVQEFQAQSVDLESANLCPPGQTALAPCQQTLTLNYRIPGGMSIGGVNIVTTGTPGLDFLPKANDSSTSLCSPQAYGTTTTCSVDVTFSPLQPGKRYGAVQILDGSGHVAVNTYIYGVGVAPALAFSPSTTSVVGAGLRYAEGIAVDASGDVFVADTNNNQVKEVLAVNGGIPLSPTILNLGSGFNLPSSVAVDGGGNIFVADAGNNAVKEILAGIGYSTVLNLGSGFRSPSGVAVDASGNVIVVDFSEYPVKEILADGGYTQVISLSDGFFGPVGVPAVDAQGDIFVTDQGDDKVKEILAVNGRIPSSPTVVSLGSGFFAPQGAAVDAAGDVFVGDTGHGAFKEILAVGGVIPELPAIVTLGSGFITPAVGAVDSAGDVFVVDTSNNAIYDIQRSQPPALVFAPTTIGTTSSQGPQAVQLQNIGNATLTAIETLSDDNDFTAVQGPGVPPDCGFGLGGTLASGAECNASFDFFPQSAGNIQATLSLIDNALDAGAPGFATQSIILSGAGVKIPQTIAFAGLPPTATYPGAGPFPLKATSSSGLPVSYSASGPATVSGATLTITGPGTVVVTASQSGDADYSAASPVAQTIVVGAKSQQTATPLLDPSGGHYNYHLHVKITDATRGASIYYTTDGSTPTARSLRYYRPIFLGCGEHILKVVAIASGEQPSTVVSAEYYIHVKGHDLGN